MAQPKREILANVADNHNGNPELALQMLGQAVSAGCDGIVIPRRRVDSCYTQDTLMQRVANDSHQQTTRGELLRGLELSLDSVKDLRGHCPEGFSFVGAPYDPDALADLAGLEPDAYQVDPPVMGHLPLLKAIADTGKKVYLVAGRCTEDDIAVSVDIFKSTTVTILHSVYTPSVPLDATALWYLPFLEKRFGSPVGYLGLNSGIHDAVAACALGAQTIEKVFTSDRFLPGPSQAFSLDRDQLREMVEVLRALAPALTGSPPRPVMQPELGRADDPQACLVAAYDLQAGEVLGESMLSIKLASDGIHPKLAPTLMGRRLAYDVPADSPLTFGFVEP